MDPVSISKQNLLEVNFVHVTSTCAILGFLISCPNCGGRSIYEFHFGGEFLKRPNKNASEKEWYDYVYGRDNIAGETTEWWYHRFGCKRWFLAVRDTRKNVVLRTLLPNEKSG
jgi:heterotetrameric sarcosine oxidase delta subunit